jgi:hypothetical protein
MQNPAAMIFVSFVLLVPLYAQQYITVRFLECKSGRPIARLNVTITAFNEYGPRLSVDQSSIAFRNSMKADGNGRVVIHLSQLLPNHIRIWGDLVEPVPDFYPAEIVKSGAVLPCKVNRTHPNLAVTAKPGEIIVINKKITAWNRMRQEMP